MALLDIFRRERPRALTAAVRNLGPFPERQVATPKLTDWQRRLYELADTNPIMKGAYHRHAGTIAQVRWVPGYQAEQGRPPISVAEAVDAEMVSDQFAVDLTDSIARITNPTDGPSGIAYRWAQNLELVADSYIAGYTDPETGAESFNSFSVDELFWETRGGQGRWLRRDRPGHNGGTPLPDAIVYRAYRAHPRWQEMPDPAVRAALEQLEELALLYAGNIALAQSRLANTGFIVYDKSMVLPELEGARNDPRRGGSAFDMLLRETWGSAISQPGSADAVVPPTLGIDPGIGPTGLRSVREMFAHVTLDRPHDSVALERIEKLEKGLAGVLPVPMEWLGFKEDSNHWSDWLIEEQAWKQYFKPTCDIQTDALTQAFVRPDMEARNHPPDQVARAVVMPDPTDILVTPDRTDDIREAYRDKVASAAAYREVIGLTEDDAPDPAEAALQDTSPTGDDTPIDNESTDRGIPDTKPTRALTARASSDPERARVLGMRLGEIDRTTMAEAIALADRALADALRLAGSRLRSAVNGNAEAKAKLRAKPPAEEVGRVLGPSLVARAGVAVDDLFEGTLDSFADRFDTLVARAQRRALREIERAGGRMDPEVRAEAEDAHAQDRALAVAVAAAGLARVARDRIFNPSPTAPPLGEFDPNVNVPASLLREALGNAGGQRGLVSTQGGGVATADGGPVTGVATGPTPQRVIRVTVSMVVVGHTWHTGDPARPFEPHQDLDGVEYTSDTDEVLANPGDWPPVDYLAISDHDGCLCSATPILGVESVSEFG